jgi:hypothetical protein
MGEPLDIDLVAASLRADMSDVGTFVESLAVKLEEMLPGHVRVDRAKRGFRGPKLVRSIAVDVDGGRLLLNRSDGDVLDAKCARVSGGITLKTDTLDFDAWLDQLGRALAAEADKSQRTRQALERLLLN